MLRWRSVYRVSSLVSGRGQPRYLVRHFGVGRDTRFANATVTGTHFTLGAPRGYNDAPQCVLKETPLPFHELNLLLRRSAQVPWAAVQRYLRLPFPDTLTSEILRLARLWGFRDAARGDDGNNKPGPRKSGKKKGDGEDGDPSAEEENPESWIVPRTCLFVLLMFALTATLYHFAQPSGKATGWSSLLQHAGDIRSVALYEHYAQVYLAQDKVHVGLVDDMHTQKKMEALEKSYKRAREAELTERLHAQQAAPGRETPEETQPLPPEDLLVEMRGRPLAEGALAAVGVFAWVVPFVFFPVLVMLLSQHIGRSVTAFADAGKSKSKVKEMIFRVETTSTTRFRDIAGMKEAKRDITEVVDFLRHPERYTKLGAKIPTGALLLGPPGTGKTLLAKAVAGEGGVGFIPVCGSDFVELYVGMGAKRVRQLFQEAKKQRCIIYIDEIDAIGLKRQGAGHGEKQEQEQTLNELLTQLDGFNTSSRGDVMVLASSNVAQEALDPALIRPGRFDRIIHVDAPVISERVDIFKVHLSRLKLVQGLPGPKESTSADATQVSGLNTTPVTAGESPIPNMSADHAADRPPVVVAMEEVAKPHSTPPTAPLTTAIVPSTLEDEKAEAEVLMRECADGQQSFDFRTLLLSKSDEERALIDVYARRMSNLCPGFVGADIANVCNEGAILAAREGASYVDITHLERSIDRVLAGIEHRSRALSEFEKKVVAHHEAGHAVAGWFLNRADPLMKVSIVPRGGSALGYAQYLPNENYTRTAKEIKDAISVSLGGRIAEMIFFQHLSTGASDDLRKVCQMAYMYVSSFSTGSVYPAPGTSHTRIIKPFGGTKSNDLDTQAKELVQSIYDDTYKLLLKHKADMEILAKHLLQHEVLTYQDVVSYLGSRSDRPSDKRRGV